MCNAQPQHELTMIGATLQSLARAGKLHVPTAAECCGKDESTIYRWIAGDSEPAATAIQLLIAHYPDGHVQMHLASALLRGSKLIVRKLPNDLDVNGDGSVDMTDALKACSDAVGELAAALRQAATQAGKRDTRIEDEDRAKFALKCERAILSIFASEEIVEFMYQQQHKRRRKARPFAVPAQEGM